MDCMDTRHSLHKSGCLYKTVSVVVVSIEVVVVVSIEFVVVVFVDAAAAAILLLLS